MATINIAGLIPVNDPAYRYKMPKLIGKVEGKGNGIKTVLVNIDQVAESLKREPAEVTKFFGTELGAQTTYTDRAIVNGAHRDADLQNHLCRYIEHFVLCRNCKLPETGYKIKEGIVSQKCLACGHRETVDMTHKLTTFILAQNKRRKELEKAADKASKKSGNDKLSTSEKVKNPKGGIPAPPTPPLPLPGAEDNSTSSTSTAKKSSLKKSKGSSEGLSESVLPPMVPVEDESEGKVIEEAIDRFKLFLDSPPYSPTSPPTVEAILDELRTIQTMSSLRPADRVIIFLGAVFNETFVVQNTIEAQKAVLSALASSQIQQRHVLAAFEWLCGSKYPKLAAVPFAKALQQLFEEDIIEEETFFHWSADTTRNEYTAHANIIEFDMLEKLHENAKPFVYWLQTADEENDDEDDDEDGEDGEEEGSEEAAAAAEAVEEGA